MSERWDTHFIRLAIEHARMSKDPSTQVGAVIVGDDREPITDGFNGFPRGLSDSEARLNDRDTKLNLIIHAELNAIINAARRGAKVKGGTMYIACTDHSGLVWGAPCTRCAVHIIQAGIREIVTLPFKAVPSRWAADMALARVLLDEAGVLYREVTLS